MPMVDFPSKDFRKPEKDLLDHQHSNPVIHRHAVRSKQCFRNTLSFSWCKDTDRFIQNMDPLPALYRPMSYSGDVTHRDVTPGKRILCILSPGGYDEG
jgi:hypothetical protein